MADMITVEQARAQVLDGLQPTPPEIVGLSESWGRVLAQDVVARLTNPPGDVSAMDGYALRAADATQGAVLRVTGAAPAGHPWTGVVDVGQAVRLFTGSLVPRGADTVLLQEDATLLQEGAAREGGLVRVDEAPRSGRHIRPMGQDFAAGDVVLGRGRRLGARDVGLAAAANHPWLAVHRKPRVAILATGDEIVMPGEPVGPGAIVSSNSHAIAALVRACGAEPVLLPIARDDRASLEAAADAVAGHDILVTIGGASVGDHDLVHAALTARGMRTGFWRVAMRPGKPLMAGLMGDVKVLGLPGNPVSSLVCSVLFLAPALRVLLGGGGWGPPTVRARLGVAMRANDHRADHLRASLQDGPDGLVVTPDTVQDSGMLAALARADALLLRAPHAPALEAGATVEVIRLDPAL